MTRVVTLLVVMAVIGVVFSASTAVADEPQETVYDFEGEDLEGAILRPLDERITGDQADRRSNLINIREDFIPEMLESVESL